MVYAPRRIASSWQYLFFVDTHGDDFLYLEYTHGGRVWVPHYPGVHISYRVNPLMVLSSFWELVLVPAIVCYHVSKHSNNQLLVPFAILRA